MELFRPISLWRYLAASMLYLVIRTGLPIAAYFSGFKKSIIGKCIILAPPKQMQIILDGIAHLQKIDSDMFLRLTAERRYVFWYHQNRFLECREMFSINDNFLLWGLEGVAVFFVQCMTEFSSKHLPLERIPKVNEKAMRHRIQQEVFEWMKTHSSSVELVKQYQEIAEK